MDMEENEDQQSTKIKRFLHLISFQFLITSSFTVLSNDTKFFRPQKWELIDPLTGRPREPANQQPRPRPSTKKRNRRPNKPQDVLFGQFFQKQIRSERFQPGPPLAPEPQAVSNDHQPIGDFFRYISLKNNYKKSNHSFINQFN